MMLLNLIAYLLFVGMVGYYFITNLQWYNYMISRVVFHHTKTWWHFVYFLVPFVLFEFVSVVTHQQYGFVVVGLYIPLFIFWYLSLDKKLVFTGRVKRFYGALYLFALFGALGFKIFSLFIPLMIAFGVSLFIEKILFEGFKRKAKVKLDSMQELTVVGITASYGKTSIKNYLEHILKGSFKTYATPRSVNTLGGIIKDINEDLPKNTEVYIVEMGARNEGDIAEITTFVHPHYALVGRIGPAHIEYFGTLENIRNTKMEIIKSNRLKEAWIHESAMIHGTKTIHEFGGDIKNIIATLDGTSFELDGVRYEVSVLGGFNAMNIAAAIKVAKALGIDDEKIKNSLTTLKSVAHRLQRIDAGGKIILDDSFNGNIDGMLASFEIAQSHNGRKVIITPGLVEVDERLNILVAQKANEIFDLVIVTGDLNYPIFKQYIDEDKLIRLADKSGMVDMLASHTKSGDLILFANDAPSFI